MQANDEIKVGLNGRMSPFDDAPLKQILHDEDVSQPGLLPVSWTRR